MQLTTTRPASSPGRADKYPPPLMRFLRTSFGSKSGRSRSRAAPLFLRRKRAAAIEAPPQEPSSPKVTCIGQVRVRRSSSRSSKPKPPPPPKKGAHHRRHSSASAAAAAAGTRFCFWVAKPPALCNSHSRRRGSCCPFIPRWPKWPSSFFRCGSVRVRTDSSKRESIPTASFQTDSITDSEIGTQQYYDDEEDDEQFSRRESFSQANGSDPPATPPKNALFLTRCRSAPHRSSYVTSRFWGSPLKTEQESRETTAGEDAEDTVPSETEPTRRHSAAESRMDLETEGNLGISKEAATTLPEKTEEAVSSNKEEEEEGIKPETAIEEEKKVVVVLTRCKSEPARRTGDPLTSSFWGERRLESTVSCLQSVESK